MHYVIVKFDEWQMALLLLYGVSLDVIYFHVNKYLFGRNHKFERNVSKHRRIAVANTGIHEIHFVLFLESSAGCTYPHKESDQL